MYARETGSNSFPGTIKVCAIKTGVTLIVIYTELWCSWTGSIWANFSSGREYCYTLCTENCILSFDTYMLMKVWFNTKILKQHVQSAA